MNESQPTALCPGSGPSVSLQAVIMQIYAVIEAEIVNVIVMHVASAATDAIYASPNIAKGDFFKFSPRIVGVIAPAGNRRIYSTVGIAWIGSTKNFTVKYLASVNLSSLGNADAIALPRSIHATIPHGHVIMRDYDRAGDIEIFNDLSCLRTNERTGKISQRNAGPNAGIAGVRPPR